MKPLRTLTPAFTICVMHLPFSVKHWIVRNRHKCQQTSMIRLFTGACHPPVWAESTALCICQITSLYRQLQCSYSILAVFKICPKVFHLNHSFICHVGNTVLICVIPVMYLQIRTHWRTRQWVRFEIRLTTAGEQGKEIHCFVQRSEPEHTY